MDPTGEVEKRRDVPTREYPPVTESGTGWPGDEPSGPPPRRTLGQRWGRRFTGLLIVIALMVAIVIGLKSVNLWPSFHDPFATEKTDRSGPVLLESIQDLSRYVAAEGSFQVIIDVQKDKKFIPD